MKRNTAYLLIGLGTGLIGGTGITWLAAKQYFQEQLNAMGRMYREDCRKCTRRQSVIFDTPIIPEPGDEPPTEEVLEEDVIPEMPRTIGDIRRDLEKRAQQRVDYHNYSAGLGYNRGDKPTLEELEKQMMEAKAYEESLAESEYPGKPGYLADADPEREGEEVFALPPKDANGWRPPYPITEEEFAYGGEDHEKVTIMYFCEDDTLMDTDESVLDIASTVGRPAILQFEQDPDIDVVYARNEKLGLDYEITRNWGSYNAMMEVDEDPPHRRWR